MRKYRYVNRGRFFIRAPLGDPVITSATPLPSGSVARHYDELDPFYRALWGEHLHHGLWRSGFETPEEATLNLLEEVALRAHLRPGMAVCDVGSGYGATARWLAVEHRAHVTAVTLSPAQAAYARRQAPVPGAPVPRYLLHDWLTNPLPDRSFDAVTALESTEHMPDLDRCLAQAYRVLRPGGRLVVCAWLSRDAPSTRELRYLLEPICREGRLAGLYTMSEYVRTLQRAGFILERADDVSLLVRRTWAVVLRRLLRGLLTRRSYWRYLTDRRRQERIFALTVPRMWLAYQTGALRYGVLSARRP